jgi:hypothetical protein
MSTGSTFRVSAFNVVSLRAAFVKVSGHLEKIGDSSCTVVLNCSGDALTAMEQILNARSKFRAATGVGGGGAGLAVAAKVGAATAPFLGPFCALPALIAGAATALGAGAISDDVFFSELEKKYGKDIVLDARGYSREKAGLYKRDYYGYTEPN